MPGTIRKLEKTPSIPKLKRVAAYARVSTEKDAMLHSLYQQVSYYSGFIQSQIGWEYAGVYADEAKTGTKESRDSFQRLLSDCRAGKVDMVITKSISRFARNTVTLLETVRELKSLGIDVYFEKEYIETALYLISTPNTGLFFAYCSIYCGFVGLLELAHYGLSLVCRLNLL